MILIVGLGNPGSDYTNTRHNAGFMAVDMLLNSYNLLWESKSKFNANIAFGDVFFALDGIPKQVRDDVKQVRDDVKQVRDDVKQVRDDIKQVRDYASNSSHAEFIWLTPTCGSASNEAIKHSKKIILCKPTTFMNLSGSSVAALASFYKIPLNNIIVIHDDIDIPLGKIKHKIGGGAGGHNGLKSIDSFIGPNYHRIRIGIGRPDNINYDISDYVLGKFTPSENIILQEQLVKLRDNFRLFIN